MAIHSMNIMWARRMIMEHENYNRDNNKNNTICTISIYV